MSNDMPMLDASTMVLVLALGNLTLCALLTFFNHGPVRAPAMTFWSLSKQIQGGAWLLLRAERAGAAGDTALEAALRRRVTVVESGGAPASAMP